MDELYCSLCYQLQIKPSILPCCHKSVCHSHISENCPICQIPINPEDTIQNWLLNELIQNSSKSICERCEKNESFSYCRECKIILCEGCYKKVHKGKYSSHKFSVLQNFKYEPDVCKTHGLDLEYFCTEEWKGICYECLPEHDEHPILDINEAATQTVFEVNNKRIRLLKLKDQIKYELDELENSKSEVERKQLDIIGITKDNFRQLHNLLDLKETETINCIDNVKEKKNSDILTESKSINKKLQRLENVIKMIDISKGIPPSVMMESMKYLTSLIQSSFDDHDSSSVSINTNFPYPEFKSLFQVFDSFLYSDLESPSKLPSQRNSSVNSITVGRRHLQSGTCTTSFSSRYASPVPFRTLTPTMGSEDVLEQRKFVSKQQTHSSIKLSWSHIIGTQSYILEYGIGSRASGVEQFRQVYQGISYNCLITDLIPKTTYRFRVCPVDENKMHGPWSDVISVATLDPPSIDENLLKNTASVNKRGDEKWIQFERAGVVMACYPFYFGKHSWEVKILSSSFFNSEESAGWLKIGVSSGKSKQIIGYVLAYANCKSMKIGVMLDVDNQVLRVKTSETADCETFNLGEGPQIPSFQYRPAKNCRNNVKVLVKFDEKANF